MNIALVNEMAVFCHELGVDCGMRLDAQRLSRSAFRLSIQVQVSAGTAFPWIQIISLTKSVRLVTHFVS